jgi:cell division topological specificity factor
VILDFLSKFEFLAKFFHREETRQTAKDRLRLVLVHDRSSIAPQIIEGLKEDLIKVINRYMEIDAVHMDIGFERKDGSIAFAANIPIIRVRRTPLEEVSLALSAVPEISLKDAVTQLAAKEEKPSADNETKRSKPAGRKQEKTGEEDKAEGKPRKASGKRKRSYPRKKKSVSRRKSVSKPVEEV